MRIAVIPVVAAVALYIGYIVGTSHGQCNHALEESKIIEVMLFEENEHPLAPQLRNYLVGRLYWNGAFHLPASYAKGLVEDFGPVNESQLGAANYRKEPTLDHSEIRELALEKVR